MQTINPDSLLRLKQIIGDKNANPSIAPIIPVSATSWWNGCRTGKYPKPIKLGEKTTVWRAREVLALVKGG